MLDRLRFTLERERPASGAARGTPADLPLAFRGIGQGAINFSHTVRQGEQMTKQISSERKTAYYIGTALMILGGLLFASTFVTFIMHFGDFSNFDSQAKSGMMRAFGGMALLVIGAIIRGIGALGIAGSGVKLDPGQAKEELEPYSRMAGGMIKDVLDEANVSLGGKTEKIVMLKCSSCNKLNEEDSKFCQECGNKI